MELERLMSHTTVDYDEVYTTFVKMTVHRLLPFANSHLDRRGLDIQETNSTCSFVQILKEKIVKKTVPTLS